MRSIRWSLILYLALLLLAALTAVSTLLYTTIFQTLLDKENSTRNIMATENTNRIQDLEKDFDNQILERAHTLVSRAQSQVSPDKPPPEVLLLHAPLLAQLRPAGIGEYMAKRIQQWLQYRRLSIRLEGEPFLSAGSSGQRPRDYFQMYNTEGEPIDGSPGLPKGIFHLDEGLRTGLKMHQHAFGEAWLDRAGDRVRLRMVTLQVPVASVSFTRPMPPRNRPGAGGGVIPPGAAAALAEAARPVPYFFFQYAQEAKVHDDAVRAYQADYDFRVANVEAEAAVLVVALKTKVLWIGLIAFVASMVGGFCLINLGLTPLQRLSEAVSQVSAKDFRIPFDPEQLPIELRPIFDRLTKTLEMLKRAFAREKQAAADISHELRTPLAALLTTLEVGMRRPRTPERYAELLRECHAIGRQMSQLVERLLALARIDAGADSLRAQEVDVAALITQCADLVRPLAEARDLKLQLQCAGSVRVTTDQNKLREVLTNLLHNAIEYNRPNGRIEVIVERHNGQLRLAVRDTGIGIPAKALDHVFERFYRVDESRQADSLHAGVGLAIVKGYLELMGGSIAVESSEGEGTTFTVQLPVRPV